MRAKAVIGASYGDEGKGRTVDWLSAPHGPAALVVRSNGGAQAGHTVERNGHRHVFHHFGSGSLVGARTHLSRFMVSHPMLFADEFLRLGSFGVVPQTTADPRGPVTTPWDMMVNQAVELARDGARHGSCGLGFGETVGRCEYADHALTVGDLHGSGLREKLVRIRDSWLPHRLAELGVSPASTALEMAGSVALLARFEAQCAAFAREVPLRLDSTLGGEADLIFEAAQGLLLDQNAPGFPYLTRSNTGLANIAAIAAEAGIAEVEPIYATRCYLTRHGRGPMEDERAIARWYAVDDPTNRPNPWQESLRFGLLDPAKLGERIERDMAQAGRVSAAKLAVTCLDQASGALAWLEDRIVREGSRGDFLEALERATSLSIAVSFASAVNESVQRLKAAI